MLAIRTMTYPAFGSPMSTRVWSDPNSKYKYGFNGQEKDDDLGAGAGNINTAIFWEYDTRLGRRWNLDPKPQRNISDYVVFANNPIIFIDPLGDEVKNGDQMVANELQEKVIEKEGEKLSFMWNNKITEETKRKEFIKGGGERKKWKEYKKLSADLKLTKTHLKNWENRAKITNEIIKKWQENSPNIFKEVNNSPVDFVLMSEDLSNSDIKGYNTFYSIGGFKTGYIQLPELNINLTLKNAVVVRIDENVLLYAKDPLTEEYNLNHEAGHFLYFINNFDTYKNYMKKNIGNYNGGHNIDDPCGINAEKYGKVKDK